MCINVLSKFTYISLCKRIGELNVTQKPSDFEPDICKAAEEGKLSSVQYLFEIEGINVETNDSYGWTPLHYVSSNGHFDIVQYLVEECHCNVEAKDNDECTSLDYASEEIRAYLKSKQ